jgi:pyridoxal phosphate enzyme (YggS family)
MSIPIGERSSAIQERIQQIRHSLPASVRLIAVTKQVSAAAVRIAYEAGIRDFGENRVQEAIAKQQELQDLSDITWHLIGHLQTNKAAKAIEHFDWIHSVDSLKLAERLNHVATECDRHPKVLLQVKLLPDPNKFGWTVPELLQELPQLDHLTALKTMGLMTIPPYHLPEAETQAVFDRARQLAEQIRQQSWQHLQMQELSMGMSNDYALAAQSGSTMVRLGRVIFGDRNVS